MYGYIMFIGSVLGTLIGGAWLIYSFLRVGKVKCVDCGTLISTFKKYIVCPQCGSKFAKRRSQIFRVEK
ncbi:hypothetical protein [Brevibacillus sp. SYSU BS000544]|uniref:hypothetical protein n=1 Tax=Brevibacillus sp. SYSU BS000544 TaxID=3416443 RepID=UPI003CE5108C